MILGIDPGQTGGIAFLDIEGKVHSLSEMPVDEKILNFAELARLIRSFHVEHCFLERAQAFPKQGIVSSFNYGRHFGHIEGVLGTIRVPYTLVTPLSWTRKIHGHLHSAPLPPKDKSRLIVHELFPGLDLRKNDRCKVIHEGKMDALLIAEYGRRRLLENVPGQALS